MAAGVGGPQARACDGCRLERFCLWGSSVGGELAVWLALGNPEMIETLVLEAPGAIVPQEQLTKPEAYSSLVADFLERREAFIVSEKNSLLNP